MRLVIDKHNLLRPYCESTLIRGYQFSWFREETLVHGFLNSWFCGFQYTHQWDSPFRWEPNFVVWHAHENDENCYPTNLVCGKNTICSCAYLSENFDSSCTPLNLVSCSKYNSEAFCYHNSSQSTEQKYTKHGF